MFRLFLILFFAGVSPMLANKPIHYNHYYQDYETDKLHFNIDNNDGKTTSNFLINSEREEMQKSAYTRDSIFKVHYDIIGENAVDIKDKNNNSIPDYIDSTLYYLEIIYQIEIVEMGFKAPRSDDGRGGDNSYDIYIKEIGNEDNVFFGITVPEDSQNLYDDGKFLGRSSYIVIDNNYSGKDSTYLEGNKVRSYSTLGIDALKATLAHEYNHSSQFMYLEDFGSNSYHTLMEQTSVFMENRVFPESPDYLNYMKVFYNSPEVFSMIGGEFYDKYIFGIFIRYIYENEKFDGDKSIIRLWEIAQEQPSLKLIFDELFSEYESELDVEWCEFASDWLYYTGERTIEGQYFADAKRMPEFDLNDKDYKMTMSNKSKETLFMPYYKYSVYPHRIYFKDINKANSDEDILDLVLASYNKDEQDYEAIIEIEYTPELKKFYNYKQVSQSKDICINDFPQRVSVIGYVYPNPFDLNNDNYLNFPVPNEAKLGDEVNIDIYSGDMQRVYNELIKVSAEGKNRVISLEASKINLSVGVYIYIINFQEKSLMGKFAVTIK